MITSPEGLQSLVRQLLGGDAGREGPEGDRGAGARVCQGLRGPLSRLAGEAGFASLMSRALALAKRRTPALEGLRVETDGSLSGSRGPAPSNGAALDADAILVTELLGLLIVFIGVPLTLTLVREAWPEVRVETRLVRTEEKS